jgi:Metallo-peptidase family M12
MTTPRRITCCILSVLALTSCGVVSKDLPLRTVRVQALGDPALRERNPRWDEEVRGLIEASSDYFDNEFGVRFVVQSTAAWPAQEKIASTAGLMVRLKKEFPFDGKREAYDLLIAFTGERVNIYNGGRGRVDRIGDCREGLGNYVVLYVSAPFRYTGATTEPTIDVIALIHELGHIFGAEHVQDSQSIMNENFDYRSTFDMKNRSVILKNRLCPFAK